MMANFISWVRRPQTLNLLVTDSGYELIAMLSNAVMKPIIFAQSFRGAGAVLIRVIDTFYWAAEAIIAQTGRRV